MAIDTEPQVITLVGCGPGSAELITPEAHKAIAHAEVLVGAPRLLDLFSEVRTRVGISCPNPVVETPSWQGASTRNTRSIPRRCNAAMVGWIGDRNGQVIRERVLTVAAENCAAFVVAT